MITKNYFCHFDAERFDKATTAVYVIVKVLLVLMLCTLPEIGMTIFHDSATPSFFFRKLKATSFIQSMKLIFS